MTSKADLFGAIAGKLPQNPQPSGPLGPTGAPQQLSSLTPNSLLMGSLPPELQTAGAIGNTSLSPLAMILAGFGAK